MTSEYKTLLYEVRDGVAIVTMNNPRSRNAFDSEMRLEMPDLIRRVAHDEAVKAMVFTGAGEVFCSGGDIRDMANTPRTAMQSRERMHRIHEWLHLLINLEKPVVAAVDGPAFGGGFNLALAADFILATPRATFCQVFGRVGLVPDLSGLYLLPRIVGLQRAKELVFSTRVLGAEEARQLGIVFELHAPEQLQQAAFDLAHRFTTASTQAIGLAKNILNRSQSLDLATVAELECHAQGLCMDSAYHKEALERFLKREKPAFSWT